MDDYGNHVDTLERELSGLLDVFKGLTPEQWQTQTLLVPFDPERPHWTLFELAEHFDISIGLAHMLVDDPQPEGQPGRDRVSFFIFPRSEVAPVVYDFAYTMVDGKTPADMPGVIETTFAKVIEGARSNPPGLIRSGYYALMELGEFIPSRVVEAVVHGLDLTDPLGVDPIAYAGGDRDDRGDPGRAARTPHGGLSPAGPVRRPGMDPGGVGTQAAGGASRSTVAADRLSYRRFGRVDWPITRPTWRDRTARGLRAREGRGLPGRTNG